MQNPGLHCLINDKQVIRTLIMKQSKGILIDSFYKHREKNLTVLFVYHDDFNSQLSDQ